ncbi:MAG: OmpA family protein [Polyangiaceae bacterium]
MVPPSPKRRLLGKILPVAAALAALAAPAVASAQQTTFYLDRLQMAGAPDDGVGVWRPQMSDSARIYGQLGFGYSLNPFRVENYVDKIDQSAIMEKENGAPVRTQLTTYVSAGAEFLSRFGFQVSFPLAVYQEGGSMYSDAAQVRLKVNQASVVPMDLRLDARAVVFRTEDKAFKLGAIASLWAPIGNKYSFGGDTTTTGMLGLAAEYDAHVVAAAVNVGYHFRPKTKINELTIADELVFGAGIFSPLLDDRLRVGAEVTGSIGIGENTTGDVDNTPIEARLQGRYKLDEDGQLYVSLAAGPRVTAGYAPDFRAVAAFGGWFNLFDTKPKSPGFQYVIPGDADKDKIPDDIDMCPNDKEDNKGPNQDDGCPEMLNDVDSDGIPDAQDACVHEPGVKDPDPAKNGCPEFIRRTTASNEITVLKKVPFAFDRADLLPDAFPILNEVVRLLKVNPEIELVRIEGHTDDFGSHKYNDDLSQNRAESVMRYMVERGIAPDHLEAKGFGKRRPLVANDTAEGREKNRRVEFHIVKTKDAKAVTPPAPAGDTPAKTPDKPASDKPAPDKPAPDSSGAAPTPGKPAPTTSMTPPKPAPAPTPTTTGTTPPKPATPPK